MRAKSSNVFSWRKCFFFCWNITDIGSKGSNWVWICIVTSLAKMTWNNDDQFNNAYMSGFSELFYGLLHMESMHRYICWTPCVLWCIIIVVWEYRVILYVYWHWLSGYIAGIILWMFTANERRLYFVKSSLISWVHMCAYTVSSQGRTLQRVHELMAETSRKLSLLCFIWIFRNWQHGTCHVW